MKEVNLRTQITLVKGDHLLVQTEQFPHGRGVHLDGQAVLHLFIHQQGQQAVCSGAIKAG